MKATLVNKYGKDVWCNTSMDMLRRDECLCLNCSSIQSCETSYRLFDICHAEDLAFAVTRCPKFREITEG